MIWRYLSYLSQSPLLGSRWISRLLRCAFILRIWRVGELGWLASDGQGFVVSKRVCSLNLLVEGRAEAALFLAFAAAIAAASAFSTIWRISSFVLSVAAKASLRCFSASDNAKSSETINYVVSKLFSNFYKSAMIFNDIMK